MTKKEDTPNITYSVNTDSLTGGWAPSPENFSVSFTEGDQLNFNDMMMEDAGKGFENMKFEDSEAEILRTPIRIEKLSLRNRSGGGFIMNFEFH